VELGETKVPFRSIKKAAANGRPQRMPSSPVSAVSIRAIAEPGPLEPPPIVPARSIVIGVARHRPENPYQFLMRHARRDGILLRLKSGIFGA
jgi:hypothetical protein